MHILVDKEPKDHIKFFGCYKEERDFKMIYDNVSWEGAG